MLCASCWTTLIIFALFSAQTAAETNEITSNKYNSCVDSDERCAGWANQGECQTNAAWMMANCRHSCQSCQGGDRAWRLRAQITSKYIKSSNITFTRIVKVESIRINHIELDENKQNIRVHGRMVLSWNDSNVTWNRYEWQLSWLNFYWMQIWTPQLIQIESTTPTGAAFTNSILAANYTGRVYLWTDFFFDSAFNFIYTNFPNDIQMICIKFDDKRMFAVKFNVSDGVRSKKREELTEINVNGWSVKTLELKDNQYALRNLSNWQKDPYDVQSSNCELCIELDRNSVYFLTEMLLPTLITSILSLSSIVFQLSTLQPLLLAFSLMTQIYSLGITCQRLPNYLTHMPTILKYDAFNLTASTLFFLSSLILRMLSKIETNIPPPHINYRFLLVMKRVFPNFERNDISDTDDKRKYSPIAHAINNLIFTILFFIYLILFTFSFLF